MITDQIDSRVPFLTGGRDPLIGLDCWGLVAYLLSHRGRNVPDDWAPGSVSDVAAIIQKETESDEWMLADPDPWLVVAMGTPKRIYHVGVSVPGRRVLHTMPKTGIVLQRRHDLRHQFGRIEFYRHRSWQ